MDGDKEHQLPTGQVVESRVAAVGVTSDDILRSLREQMTDVQLTNTENQPSARSNKLAALRQSLMRQELETTFQQSPDSVADVPPEARTHPETQPSNHVSEPEALGRIAEQELSKAR